MGEAKRRRYSPICGGCTMCCTLYEIDELEKAYGQKCTHQTESGCAIHKDENRPNVCKTFMCRYVLFNTMKYPQHVTIPHPLKCGAFFCEDPSQKLFILHASLINPNKWKSSKIVDYLSPYIAVDGFSVVVIDRGYQLTASSMREWKHIIDNDLVSEAIASGMPPNLVALYKSIH